MKPASIIRRFEAAITSAFMVLVWMVSLSVLIDILFWLIGLLVQINLPAWAAYTVDKHVYNLLVIVLLIWAGSKSKATYGMLTRQIRFESSNEQPLTASRTTIRILVGILLLPALPISVVMMLLNPQRQSLADKLCNTIVIDVRKEKATEARGFDVIQPGSQTPPLPPDQNFSE